MRDGADRRSRVQVGDPVWHLQKPASVAGDQWFQIPAEGLVALEGEQDRWIAVASPVDPTHHDPGVTPELEGPGHHVEHSPLWALARERVFETRPQTLGWRSVEAMADLERNVLEATVREAA